MIYAVIDTNVFVAALLTKHRDAATAKVVEAVVAGRITAVGCIAWRVTDAQ